MSATGKKVLEKNSKKDPKYAATSMFLMVEMMMSYGEK